MTSITDILAMEPRQCIHKLIAQYYDAPVQRKGPHRIDYMTRFNNLLDKASPNGCWNWLGASLRGGYGQFNITKRKAFPAHRFALAIHTGHYPPPHVLCLHLCDNPKCCNPLHLKWGTASENALHAYARNKSFRRSAKANMRIVANKQAPRHLVPSQIDYIKQLRSAGYSQDACASWYGVSQRTIGRIDKQEGCYK